MPSAGREVTLLTYDTGQSMGARMTRLPVHTFTKPLGKEPA